MKPIGYFTFVLHSHLPYVISHGRWPHGMDWLDEAAIATYIPLLNAFSDLANEGISAKCTVGITPILAEMLSSQTFKDGLPVYLKEKVRVSQENVREFQRTGERQLKALAQMWEQWFSNRLNDFEERYGRDLIGAFRKLQEQGHIEIITCAATHGYLPLLSEDISIQAQIKAGIKAHQRHFGCSPKGIWLPECAYRPSYAWASPLESNAVPKVRKGVEEFLSENGIDFFMVDTHLLHGGEAVGVYMDRFSALRRLWAQFEKEYAPAPVDVEKSPYDVFLVGAKEGKKPVAILTRDDQTGLQVWSGEHGYPGDGAYLDFHKKYSQGGNRYWCITSPKADLADKEMYNPQSAQERIPSHADHFVKLVTETLRKHHQEHNRPGLVCAPFDTELFGHWWWEGPQWLKAVLAGLAASDEVQLVTGSEYLETSPASVIVSLPEGSWGKGGFHFIWLNEDTKWTWRHIYEAERDMIRLAQKYASNDDADLQRIMKQLARENLLLQSSDWQFLISTWSARDYSELRFDFHLNAFRKLRDLAEKKASGKTLTAADWTAVEELEARDQVFPDIDVSWWQRLEYP